MREVGGGEVNIGVTIRRYQVYAWCVAMQFLTDICQFLPITLNVMMYM